MFGFDVTVLAFIGLAAFGVGGILFVFMFDSVNSEAKQAKRLKSIKGRDLNKKNSAQARINDAAKRRTKVQESLKELDEKQKEKHQVKVPLKKQLQQAGLKINPQQFYIMSILFAVVASVAAFIGGAGLLTVGGVFVASLLGIPRWLVSHLRKKRFKAFMTEFPNAVDVIVRGVKAGLPLNDCLMIISKEAKEPVRSEFGKIIEAQQMGLSLTDAIGKLYKNVPITEANFFSIVIAIQQQAGGNLSEALGNLSNVLRDRKKLDGKIKAMSAEAKASAGIIGSLPFAVCLLVYITTPDYILLLFTHPTGNMILLGAGVWMSIGIMVMRNMINFDF